MRKFLIGLVSGAAVGASVVAMAAGFYTPGMPTVGPTATANGVATVFPNNVVSEMGSAMLVPVDTGLANGQVPQTVAATGFQMAGLYAEMAGNTGTSTVHAATLNTKGGVITTESLSTAVGATYTFTLTDSLVTATGNPVQVAMYSATNTGGTISLTSTTNAAGSVTFVWTNVGTTAFNGTMTIVFHI